MERLGRRLVDEKKKKKTYLGIESRDLAVGNVENLLSVRVIEEVVLDLFGLGGHLMQKILAGSGRYKGSCERT